MTPPPAPTAHDTVVDLLVVGSGTGLLAALAAVEEGLSVLVVEKADVIGGSTALSGGAFWIPGNAVLAEDGSDDTVESAATYLEDLVGEDVPRARWTAYLDHGPEAVDLMRRRTPLELAWAEGYPDYHTQRPGASTSGRSVESDPFDLSVLGKEADRVRPPAVGAPVPVPVTGRDYRWLNLLTRRPGEALPRVARRVAQGVGGMALGRTYVALGTALAGGLYAGVRAARVPVWTGTGLVRLVRDVSGEGVKGAVVSQDGREVTVTATRGVVLAAGGFDHHAELRREHQSPSLDPRWPLGAETNTGDALLAARAVGADTDLMDQAWWFPAVAPVGDGRPGVLLAERALPGSLLVDRHGRRFVNEAVDYMSFGQEVLRREAEGDPVGDMWLVFDQTYRDSYLLATEVYPRMPLPRAWVEAGIAHTRPDAASLAEAMGVPVDTFVETGKRFNELAVRGVDRDFHRGESAYDRYYGDPTVTPNPTLRPLTSSPLHAVRLVLADLGTCGGLRADEHARVLREDGSPIEGLYAIGNTAANVFGRTYPGAGATIGQGLVFGLLAARHAARRSA